MRTLLTFALILSLVFQIHQEAGHSAAPFYEPPTETATVPEAPNFNLPFKTTDFTQIWTDYRWRDGYRVQKNALTGHWRLIDPENVRRAWGTKGQCLDELDKRCPRPNSQTAGAAKPVHHFVLLHGLMRTCNSMKSLDEHLAKNEHPHSIRFSYASTRGSIGKHAGALRELLEDLPEHDTFSFVGHSMGNIVVRRLIGDLQSSGDPHNILPRCRSMVMLGPPNQGAMIAERLAPTKVFGWVTGQGGMELGQKWAELEPTLATPPFPFHIIAGDVESPVPNPLVEGHGDFVVRLEEARLDGSASFTTVPVLHSFLMDNEKVMDKTIELLNQDLDR